ncbi:MAG: hypothetical protein KGJ60_00345 [Verrucomicrobiota bacterium]|nr:hypothetical protein [Verrucomicrobiota bacterium]
MRPLRQKISGPARLRRGLGVLCCLAALVPAVPAQRLSPEQALSRVLGTEGYNNPDNWTRHFRLGLLTGLNIRAQFGMSGNFAVSGSGTPGVYDDGYVRVDQTGDAGNQTSYWGYDNASQYDPATRALRLTRTQSFTATGGGSGDDAPYLGFDLAYGDSYWRLGRAKVGWEFGFGLLPIHISDNQPMSASVTRSLYSFDVGNILLPAAPYHGGPGGLGPTISDLPTATNHLPAVSSTVTGTRSLDVTLFSFRLGPTLYWDVGRQIGLYVGAGPAAGLVTGDLKWDEAITASGGSVAQNHGQIGGTDAVFGGYVNATLVYHPVANGDIYLGAQYMPMTGVTLSGAGREGHLDLGGQVYISAGINWTF